MHTYYIVIIFLNRKKAVLLGWVKEILLSDCLKVRTVSVGELLIVGCDK